MEELVSRQYRIGGELLEHPQQRRARLTLLCVDSGVAELRLERAYGLAAVEKRQARVFLFAPCFNRSER